MTRTSTFLALVVALVLIAGCGGSSSTAEQSGAAVSPDEPIGHGSGELNCKTFPFDGSGTEDWRQDSYFYGPFGVSHNLAAGSREADGLLHSKTPMLVEGHEAVVLSVPERERDRVAIEILKPDHASRRSS